MAGEEVPRGLGGLQGAQGAVKGNRRKEMIEHARQRIPGFASYARIRLAIFKCFSARLYFFGSFFSALSSFGFSSRNSFRCIPSSPPSLDYEDEEHHQHRHANQTEEARKLVASLYRRRG